MDELLIGVFYVDSPIFFINFYFYIILCMAE